MIKINSIIYVILFSIILMGCGRNNLKPVKLEFFETYSFPEISAQYGFAVTLSHHNELTSVDSIFHYLAEFKKEDSLGGIKTKGLEDLIKSGTSNTIGYVYVKDTSKVNSILKRKDIQQLFPKDLQFVWSAKEEKTVFDPRLKMYILYAIRIPENGIARVNGKHIKTAVAEFNEISNSMMIDLEMTEEGSEILETMTRENLQKTIAICADRKVISAPLVFNAIVGGKTQISGDFSEEEAEELVASIMAGK